MTGTGTCDTQTTCIRHKAISPGIGVATVGMEVKVGPIRYRITEDSSEIEEGRCGVTYKQTARIRINPSLSADVRKETLLHEMLHAICSICGIDDEDRLTEEEWISRVSPILLMVLQENPDLLSELGIHDS